MEFQNHLDGNIPKNPELGVLMSLVLLLRTGHLGFVQHT